MTAATASHRYVIGRLAVVLPCLALAAALMAVLRAAEARLWIPADASQLASIVYFHIASFGILWCALRAPFHWPRVLLVGIWLIADFFCWLIVASFDGLAFRAEYLTDNALATLMHRYVFLGTSAVMLTFVRRLHEYRIVHREEFISRQSGFAAASRGRKIIVPDVSTKNFSFGILSLFIVTTYLAVGIAINRIEPTYVHANALPTGTVWFLDAITVSDAFWSVLRGLIMWLLALHLVGRGPFQIRWIMVAAICLPLINIALIQTQDWVTDRLLQWRFRMPSKLPSKMAEALPILHPLLASMLSLGSVLWMRALGYSFRAVESDSVREVTHEIQSEGPCAL